MSGSSLPVSDLGFSTGLPGSSPEAAVFPAVPGALQSSSCWDGAGFGRLRIILLFPSDGSSFLVGEGKKHKPIRGENKRECLPTVCCVLLLFVVFLRLLWQPREDMPGCSIAGTSAL